MTSFPYRGRSRQLDESDQPGSVHNLANDINVIIRLGSWILIMGDSGKEHPAIEESAPTTSSWGLGHGPGYPSRMRWPLSGAYLRYRPKTGAEALVYRHRA